jgi:hypothetical protein
VADLRERLIAASLALMNISYTDEELADRALVSVAAWLRDEAEELRVRIDGLEDDMTARAVIAIKMEALTGLSEKIVLRRVGQ